LPVCEVFTSSRSSTVRRVMFTCRVTSLTSHNMYPIPVIYQRIFNQLIQILLWLVDSDLFLAFWWKSREYYCKRLQNGGALNFAHFFLDHSVLLKLSACCLSLNRNIRPKLSSSSSLKFLEWPKQQCHHENHYSQSKYEQIMGVCKAPTDVFLISTQNSHELCAYGSNTISSACASASDSILEIGAI